MQPLVKFRRYTRTRVQGRKEKFSSEGLIKMADGPSAPDHNQSQFSGGFGRGVTLRAGIEGVNPDCFGILNARFCIQCSYDDLTRSWAIAVVRVQVLISAVHKIKSLQFKPCNTLCKVVTHKLAITI